MNWDQIFIAIFGVSAIWLVNDIRPRWRRWGSVCGLVSQPFWFYMAISQDDWGVLILCFFYLYAWGRGFYNAWLKENK